MEIRKSNLSLCSEKSFLEKDMHVTTETRAKKKKKRNTAVTFLKFYFTLITTVGIIFKLILQR